MPSFRTYNRTDKSLWVTIYTLGRVFKEDWGEVGRMTWRDWESGHYAAGSYYNVRGEWPMFDTKYDTDTTRVAGGIVELVLRGGDQGVWWSRPVVRTTNKLSNTSIWVTIYSQPGDVKKDWGHVDPGGAREWESGDYHSGEVITLQAEWTDGLVAARDAQAPEPVKLDHKVRHDFVYSRESIGLEAYALVYDGNTPKWISG